VAAWATCTAARDDEHFHAVAIGFPPDLDTAELQRFQRERRSSPASIIR
jgi:hypothetical protein